jgi:hypothetical protein
MKKYTKKIMKTMNSKPVKMKAKGKMAKLAKSARGNTGGRMAQMFDNQAVPGVWGSLQGQIKKGIMHQARVEAAKKNKKEE